MRKNTSIRNGLIIAVITLAVAASLFTFNYVRAGKTIENLNAGLDKDTEAAQDAFNDPNPNPPKENIRYASLPPNKGVVEIKEKMFLAQVNDVYLNPEDYMGKTIKLEGLFKEEQGYEKSYCFVLRYGPGCCGNDGNVGFEVAWAAEQAQSYPAENSWVEAAGVLKSYEEDGYFQYLYLDLVSLNVLSKRGAETVLQ
jgi:uncharacterized membrane protein YcgQ (UPF0703/DUF1980 family)